MRKRSAQCAFITVVMLLWGIPSFAQGDGIVQVESLDGYTLSYNTTYFELVRRPYEDNASDDAVEYFVFRDGGAYGNVVIYHTRHILHEGRDMTYDEIISEALADTPENTEYMRFVDTSPIFGEMRAIGVVKRLESEAQSIYMLEAQGGALLIAAHYPLDGADAFESKLQALLSTIRIVEP